MTRILIVNGPNLGRLGIRRPQVYGTVTLEELQASLADLGAEAGIEVIFHQSDVEGHIIQFVDAHRDADGMVLNPGALMMHGWGLRDCLEDFDGLRYEVHISNVFARETFRHTSILAPVMDAFISGLGIAGYTVAVRALTDALANGGGRP